MRFGGDVEFAKVRFSGHANFDGAQFGGHANFDEARFEVSNFLTSFREAQFEGDADFEGTTFGVEAFDGKADGGADFGWARFGGAADFIGARFEHQHMLFSDARSRPSAHHTWPTGWTTRDARTADGEEDGWLYLVRVEDGGKQQPDQEERSDNEAGTSGS